MRVNAKIYYLLLILRHFEIEEALFLHKGINTELILVCEKLCREGLLENYKNVKERKYFRIKNEK